MRISCVHLALADDGLVDAAQVHGAGHGRNVEIDVHGDVAVVMDAGREVHVYADIDDR